MKKLLLFTALLVANLSQGNELLRFKLNKDDKLQSTYSASIGNGSSVHFVIAKNGASKKFLLMPYLVDASNKVKKLNSFASENNFNIVSFHSNNDILSIVDYNSDDKELISLTLI